MRLALFIISLVFSEFISISTVYDFLFISFKTNSFPVLNANRSISNKGCHLIYLRSLYLLDKLGSTVL